MIFADKLVSLRKKCGYTQEELAEKMDVSRQSIAKWEGAQSIPELSKIVKLSKLFGVSTDYLLKDELEEAEPSESVDSDAKSRLVTLDEAARYIALRAKAARSIALGVALCILSPVCLIFLAAYSDMHADTMNENLAAGLGLCVLLCMVGAAVALFIRARADSSGFEFLETDEFETAYGVDGMVKERRAEFKPTRDRNIILGTVICIMALIPLFIGIAINPDNDVLMIACVCVMLALVAVGVWFFVSCSIVWASFNKLLQDGDYTKQSKRERKGLVSAVSSAYWLVITAAFLAYSFITNNWDNSWIIWPVAAVLYPAIMAIVKALSNKD